MLGGMLVYIIRHADPDYEAGTITAYGHKEAEALAERMPTLRPTRLYSSPLGRALHTAEYSVRKTGLELHQEAWTKELSGLDVEQPPPYGVNAVWDLHGEVIRTSTPEATTEQWLKRLPCNDTAKVQRVFDEVGRNSDEFFARHGYHRDGGVYRITGNREQRLAVFCHGGFGLTWLAHLLAIPLPLVWSGFYLWPSSVTTLLFDERTEGVSVPRCIGLADVSHLYAAGLAPRPRGIKANWE